MVAPPERKHSVWLRIHIVLLFAHFTSLESFFHNFCSSVTALNLLSPNKKERESLFLVNGMLMAPLVTAGVSDDVSRELQMPSGPEALEDVEESVSSRP